MDGILGIKISPPFINFNDFITNFIACSCVIKNLVILISVIGKNDEPLFLSSKKKGITDPLEFITFPYLTIENFVFILPDNKFAETKSLSAANLDAPYKLIGLTALSVDKAKTFLLYLLLKLLLYFQHQLC